MAVRPEPRVFGWPSELLPTVRSINGRTGLGPRSGFGPMAPVGWRSDQEIADLMGTARRMVTRFRALGLTYWWADRLATALHRHPSDIWPDWWDVTGLMVLVDDGTISHVEARALCGVAS